MHTEDDFEAGFRAIRYLRFVEKMRGQLHKMVDPDYWRRLNPELTISDHPFGTPRRPHVVPRAAVDQYLRYIQDEGYIHTPPLIATEDIERLRSGILRIVREGLPSVFAYVYDEFYQIFDGVSDILSPILGKNYLMVPDGFWVFCVTPVDAPGAWLVTSSSRPHRDSLGPDPNIVERKRPTVVNVWIPLTDATPLSSCIYLVPAHRDPDYYTRNRKFHADHVRFPDIRAVPATAGSVLVWTMHLLHWGSHGSRHATEPRVSVAVAFQNRDVPPYHETACAVPSPVSFEERLRWIAMTINDPKVFDFPPSTQGHS